MLQEEIDSTSTPSSKEEAPNYRSTFIEDNQTKDQEVIKEEHSPKDNSKIVGIAKENPKSAQKSDSNIAEKIAHHNVSINEYAEHQSPSSNDSTNSSEKDPDQKGNEDQQSESDYEEPRTLFSQPRRDSQPEEYIIYKSMNFMSFSTRHELMHNMTQVKLVDNNPRQAVKIVDDTPPDQSTKKCQILKYWSEEKKLPPSKFVVKKRSKKFPPASSTPKKRFRSPSGDKRLGHTKAVKVLQTPVKSICMGRNELEADAAETLVALANSGEKMEIRNFSPMCSTPKQKGNSPFGRQSSSVPGTPRISSTSSSPASLVNDEDFQSFADDHHGISSDTVGNPIHKCNLCFKVFTIYEAYYTHVYTHFKHRNKCTVCGKIFSRSWLLKGHMRTHTGERPYKCDYPGCTKAFADRSNLRSHTMIHQTKEKGFVCEGCNRAFAQKRYLHKHQLEVCRGDKHAPSPQHSTGSGSSTNSSVPFAHPVIYIPSVITVDTSKNSGNPASVTFRKADFADINMEHEENE